MRKIASCAILAVFLVFCASLAYAQQETNQIMEELNKELEQQKVFLPNELKDMQKSLGNAMKKGVKKEDLKAILVDLKNKQTSVKDTKKTIDVMVDLIKSGVNPKEAGNIVSRVAHQAKAEGLKGTALAARVREAIQTRKAEQEKLKQQNREIEMHQKEHKEKHEGQIQAQELFREKAKEKESHGSSSGHGKGKR